MPPTARRLAAGPCMAAVLLAGCTRRRRSRRRHGGRPRPRVRRRSTSSVVADGLDHPWDVAQAPDGTLLVDERAGGFTAVLPGRHGRRRCEADFGDLFARGETGLMGLVLDPGFAANRRFYTCQGVTDGASASIEVIGWTVADDWRTRHPRRRPADRRHPGQPAAPAGTAAAGCGSRPTGRC